ncbi:MAG: flagellar biosynthesis anti-sigma factor FlgM [Candidatus Marinimicrobia bacterium]|nr:flagellar biosynthesis anti-sigma factor FlgM [Candidatus Neomarinimicrobiota bacterium]
MTPIKNIGDPLSSADKVREQERLRESQSSKVRKDSSVEQSSTTERPDSVNISSAARRLAESTTEVSRFQQSLDSLREPDAARLEELRQRIESGEFERPEVIDRLADSILRLPQFESGSSDSAVAPRSEEELKAVAERVRSGDYETEVVLQRVASSILNDIGAL